MRVLGAKVDNYYTIHHEAPLYQNFGTVLFKHIIEQFLACTTLKKLLTLSVYKIQLSVPFFTVYLGMTP